MIGEWSCVLILGNLEAVALTAVNCFFTMEKKIAVIEDDSGALELISTLIGNLGFDIFPVRGPEALVKIQSIVPDLVLVDNPLTDAFVDRLSSNLKTCRETIQIPVLLISASPGLRNKTETQHVDDFLVKPFALSELTGKIHYWINHPSCISPDEK